jgi:hypothetical protein
LPRLPGLVRRLVGRPVAVTGAVRGSVQGLFEGLLPAEVIEAYERLIDRDGCAKDQAEALVGGPGLVAALTGWGIG